jgi:hypothetical protein
MWIVIALLIGFAASKAFALLTWKKRLRRRAAFLSSLTERERRIVLFRRECIESMVSNTCDNIYDTGNSLSGVSMGETAAYYLVRASYCEGDIEDVACELSETAALYSELDDHGLSAEDFRLASRWAEMDVKTEGVDALRDLADDTAGRPYMFLPMPGKGSG